MDQVIIETTLDKVLVKKVGAIKAGEAGAVYLPKGWIGKNVKVVLDE